MTDNIVQGRLTPPAVMLLYDEPDPYLVVAADKGTASFSDTANALAAEYGFWANVNPAEPHPRWSQASESLLGTDERRPTQLFNGYGEYVAHLYKGLDRERLWA